MPGLHLGIQRSSVQDGVQVSHLLWLCRDALALVWQGQSWTALQGCVGVAYPPPFIFSP